MTDIVLTEDDDRPGQILAHRLDCPMIAAHRAEDRFIATLIGVARPLPDDLKRHACMAEGGSDGDMP